MIDIRKELKIDEYVKIIEEAQQAINKLKECEDKIRDLGFKLDFSKMFNKK